MSKSTGWRIGKLGDLAYINPVSVSALADPGWRFRYIDLSSVDRGQINWANTSELTFAHAPSRARRLVDVNDVLFGTVRPALQSHGIISASSPEPLVASTGFSVLRARIDTNPYYLFHLIMSHAVLAEARRFEVGSNYPAVNESDVRQFAVPIPPPGEQMRIAEILDAADKAIRSTERLITKLEHSKKGLLHDLLTCGIDEFGRLRDRTRRPQQFARTRAGLLPKAWPVVSIGQIVISPGSFIQTGPFGSQLHANEYTDEGIPVVMPQDIDADEISASSVARISSKKAEQLGRHKMRTGDIVFARRGDLSKCAAITPSQDGWLCGTGCLLLRPPAGISASWFAALYRHEICQRQIAATAVGTTMVNLNTSLVSSLRIPLPSSEEQQRISEVIAAEEAKAVRAADEVEKLRLLKQGLINDLLTGRVRVGVPA